MSSLKYSKRDISTQNSSREMDNVHRPDTNTDVCDHLLGSVGRIHNLDHKNGWWRLSHLHIWNKNSCIVDRSRHNTCNKMTYSRDDM
jgi:hypothetical protein